MPTQADWERVCYHEAGHAVVMMELWGEPAPIVLRCVNRDGTLKAEGTFQLPMALQAPEPDDPNPLRKLPVHLVMGSAGGQVAELARYGDLSDGVAGDDAKIKSILKVFNNDQAIRSEINDGFPRTRQILQRERVAWEKIAEHCISEIERRPLPWAAFPNRTVLDAEAVGRIFAKYRSSLSSEEQADARLRAYHLSLSRGGGQVPSYDPDRAAGDFCQAVEQVMAERPAV